MSTGQRRISVEFPVRKARNVIKRKSKTFDDENRLSNSPSKKRISNKTPSDYDSRPLDADKTSKESALSGFREAKKALHSSVPVRFLERDVESQQILEFLRNCLENKQSGSLYISGAPGTGKTACLTRLFESREVKRPFEYVYVNCMSFKQSTAVYQKIAKELDYEARDLSQKTVVGFLEKKIVTSNDMIVLVLDEIDQLDSKNQEVLYTLFEWPCLRNSKLVLVGIANALDLTDRVLPRLHAYGCRPKLLHFRPYTHQQILSILEDRLKDVSANTEIFKPAALLLCARKIAASSGDVRKALDVCRRAIEVVEAEGGRRVLKASSENGCNPGSPKRLSGVNESCKQVDVSHINSVFNEIYGSRAVLTCISKEGNGNGIPLQQKIILCTLLLVIKITKTREVTLGKLYSVYSQICRKRQMSTLDQMEYCSTCSLLESQGLVNMKKSKDVRSSKVSLKVNEQELEYIMQDRTLLASILNDSNINVKKS
ncbi:cell division control protein 6 homolog [Centruroides sculpturatus]|uniref:cell division control protein 6 homolog n=1 Tax=Centruroides sculpturatus TaxID=218467 RepID=UPI000C6DB900|nr:cell division control protein 6 homolog [Centruroides sculpturatus]